MWKADARRWRADAGSAPRRPHANGRAARVHGALGGRVPRRPAALVAWPLDRSLATERGRSVRYLVECFFHKLKACRRIATRYEKTARNYLALIHLACALQWIDAQTPGR